ncbi:hypothetical protein R3P38DRAFT_2588663, partial [Favolaschia claudopus]
MLADGDLTLCLPPCTPTFFSDAHKTWSTIDLVFATPRLVDTVTKCIATGGYGSDHRCIDTTINLTLAKVDVPPRFRWRDVDWDEFSKAADEACSAENIAERVQDINNTDELDSVVSDLLNGYVKATEDTVPVADKTPFSKRWFTAELKQQLRDLNKVKNRAARKNATQAERDAVKRARNAYHNALQQQKSKHWREWLEDATERTVWQAHKYASHESSETTASRVPDLQTPEGPARTNEEKCGAFRKQFFPDPPPADLSDIDDAEYPAAKPTPPVTEGEVKAVIDKLPPYRAPGGSRVPNIALQKTSKILVPLLTRIANACLRLSHHPALWKIFIT